MALRGISARFECDGCGKSFEVFMDPAMEVNGGSLAEAAEHSAKEDLMIEVEDGTHTCEECCRKRDVQEEFEEHGE